MNAWRWVVPTVLLLVGVIMSVDVLPSKRWQRKASDCYLPACCGFTPGSTGCRFQGNQCRCPFFLPSAGPSPFLPFGTYPWINTRRYPSYDDD